MSTPPFHPDDPRLTAYALGEGDEGERQAVETFLSESAEGRAEVEQTQAIARVLTAEYSREHGLYLESHPTGALPRKVVAFSSAQNRSWRHVTVPLLKIAAVLALGASLVYLTLRGTHRADIMTMASAPPVELPHTATPGLVSADKDTAVATRDEENSDSGPLAGSGHPDSAATASTVPTGSSADASLAMEPAAPSDKISETEAGGRAADAFSRTEAAPPPFARAAPQSAPGAASPAALAKPSSPEERIARSVVRIRTAAGVFFGGVLVSTDGLILAASPLPESALQSPCTVFLADQRERPTVGKSARTRSGWYRLQIDANALPAATLAREFPAKGAPLTTASVEPRTGKMTVLHVSAGGADSSRRASSLKLERSPQTASNVSFAFNAAGELLVIDQAAEQPYAAEQAKARVDSVDTKKWLARPFTDAERAELQQAATRNGSE